MHILFITHYYEPDSGAAAVRLTRLAKILHQHGHEVTVLTTMPHYPTGIIAEDYRGKWSTDENRDGVRVIQVWLWTTPSKSLAKRLISQLSFKITAFLRGLSLPRPDVVFIENQPMFTGLAGRLLADVKRAPYVLNVSDLWPDHLLSVGALSESSLIYKILREMVDAGYRGAERVIVLSSGFTKRLLSQQPKLDGKFITQVNGVDLAKFYPMTQAEIADFCLAYDIDLRKKWVTFIGTFATQYDFDLLLDVAKHFLRREDVAFLFIGTGSLEPLVADRIASDSLTNIKRITWLEHDEMPFAWNVSTVTYWAFRSAELYQDVIPAKLFEVLASGVPIVAAQDSLSNAMINDAQAGLIVPCGDLQEMIAALTEMLDDETIRQSARENGRAYAEAHFDPYKVASTYETALSQAIRKQ